MFSVRQREDLRDRLAAAAKGDDRITAAALVGSAALSLEDEWSDIDLALRLADGHDPADVVTAWTGRMYDNHDAVDHLDIWSGRTLFRVFLLSTSLQVLPAELYEDRAAGFRDRGSATLRDHRHIGGAVTSPAAQLL